MSATKPPSRVTSRRLWTLVAFLANVLLAHGQRFEITPLVGVRAGGSVDVQQEGQPPQGRAHLADSGTFGVAAGIRFFADDGCDDCSVIEFRWMRQNTKLGFKESTPVATPLAASFGRTAVTLDHYLADLTYEWNIETARAVRPFVMASLGVARMLTPVSSNARFAFGLGAGVKIFPKPHWGFRFGVEYLPTVMHAEVQRLTCVNGCVIVLNGGLMNQFDFSIGPVFRF